MMTDKIYKGTLKKVVVKEVAPAPTLTEIMDGVRQDDTISDMINNKISEAVGQMPSGLVHGGGAGFHPGDLPGYKSANTRTSFGVNSAGNLGFYDNQGWDSVVIVREAADFNNIDSTKVYVLDGIIDMGSTSIEIPAGGLSIAGWDFDISKLTSSAAGYTMFTSPVGGSGDFLAKDIAVEVTGAGSQVYDVADSTGFHAIEVARINWNDCTSMGTIDGYRQGLETGTGRFGGTPHLTLAGTWVGGYFIDTSIVRSLAAGMTGALFQAGAGFSMASRFRSNQNIDLPPSAAFLDFAPSNFTNPSTLQLQGCLVSRGGVFNFDDSNLTPNTDEKAIESAWTGNQGLRNTHVGGIMTATTEGVTTINTINVFETLASTWVASDLQHFDEPSTGQLRHIGNTPSDYRISGAVDISGSSGDLITLKVRKWDASGSVFVDVETQTREIYAFAGSTDVAFFNILIGVVLDVNDYIYLQVANTSGTGNVTAKTSSYFTLVER